MSEANRARVQQIVAECFVKAAHIILGSRIYQSSRILSKQGPKCWFNLKNEEVECAQREVELWRRDPSCPMIIEIYLQPWGANEAAALASPATQAAGIAGRRLLERWVLSYSPVAPADAKAAGGRTMTSRLEPAAIYKRMVISLRSLFSYIRVLPAYRLFRACAAQQAQEKGGISLQYRISRGMPGTTGGGAVPPRLDHFSFTPVETPHGLFRMSVDFAPSSTVTILKETTSPGPVAQIIQDYASSGSAARRAPAMATSMHVGRGADQLPDPASSPPISSGAGILRTGPQQAMLRRHSWSTHGLRSALNSIQRLPGQALGSPSPSLPATPVSGGEAAARNSFAAAHSPAQERGGCANRLATQSEGSQTEEAGGAAGPSAGHAWVTPPKHPGTPTSPHYAASAGGAVRTWSRAIANQEALAAKARQRGLQEQQQSSGGQPVPLQDMNQEGTAKEVGGGVRQSSAPVCIPGASESSHRSRIHSSGDLAALQQPHASPRPLKTVRWTSGLAKAPASAPAASAAVSLEQPPHPVEADLEPFNSRTTGFHVPVHSDRGLPGNRSLLRKDSGGGSSVASLRRPSFGSGASSAQPPHTPPALGSLGGHAGHGGAGSESSGSAASSYPASCSPQLPFAFTPSALSLSSFHDHPVHGGAPTHGVGGGSAAASPTAAAAGALTVFRRPSAGASPHSSAFDLPAAPGALGYSLSPVQGSLESSLMGASTPRYPSTLPLTLPSSYTSPLHPATRLGVASSGASFSSAVGPPRLTYPGSASGEARELAALPSEEAEADVLPFALDADAVPPSLHPPLPFRMSLSGMPSPPEQDEEVGAFVRAIQEAPPSLARGAPVAAPLSGLGSAAVAEQALQAGSAPNRLTLQAGLDQLLRFKARLEAI